MTTTHAQPGITFVIPIRHPQNSSNWSQLKSNFEQTVRSIAQQDSPNWNVVICANQGADLPPLPANFAVAWVDFPPNPRTKSDLDRDRAGFDDSLRFDKGRRLLAAMMHGPPREYLMLVDDDDFISRKLVSFAESHRGENGWCFSEGYIWPDGGRTTYLDSGFSTYCGTSHIVRADLYRLPARFEDAAETYIKQMLGSHVFIDGFLEANGTPLAPLPFPGAIYRVSYSGATTQSKGIIRSFFITGRNLRNPLRLLDALTRLRRVTPELRGEFGLPQPA